MVDISLKPPVKGVERRTERKNRFTRIFHTRAEPLINTGAFARWKDALWLGELFQFQQFVRSHLLLFLFFISPARAAQTNQIQFNRDIRPILSENCYACHGPDKNQRKAKLRLDMREIALEKEAIVPRQPDKSKLI